MSFCTDIGRTRRAFRRYKLFYMRVQYALFENVETSIAKCPSEYGKAYIEERYRAFRDQFFGGDAGNLPERMPIGYSDTIKALGHCMARISNAMGTQTVRACEIKLSDAYDFTPKKLDEVLIHEMIHAYLFHSKDPLDVKASHGPRFQAWCNKINAMSNYHITTANDTPMTLNHGMANRIANDGTVILVAKDVKNGESALIRVDEKNLTWAIPRAEEWTGKQVTPYACSDSNFKKRFTICKTRLTALMTPNSTVDDMIADGILKEIPRPDKDAPQDALLIAWHWHNDSVAFALVAPRFVDTFVGEIHKILRAHGIEDKISKYRLTSYFHGWESAPVSMRTKNIKFKTLERNAFNLAVEAYDLKYLGDA